MRGLYTLVSECRGLGADGIGWRSHLVNELVKLLDVDVVLFADYEVVGPPGSEKGWMRPISVVDRWPTEANRCHFWEVFLRKGRHEHTPLAHMAVGHHGVRVASRRDAIPDELYYESDFYQQYIAPMQLGDFVHSVSRKPNSLVQMLTIQRTADRPDLPRWTVHWLRALWIELRKMQTDVLKCVDESVFTQVPRRRLQVLACLLSGCTVNETAGLLSISPNTAQEHVKRLYQQTGARNRAELAAHCKEIAHVLLALPLDKFPDYARDIKQATRAPWPAEPSLLLPCEQMLLQQPMWK